MDEFFLGLVSAAVFMFALLAPVRMACKAYLTAQQIRADGLVKAAEAGREHKTIVYAGQQPDGGHVYENATGIV